MNASRSRSRGLTLLEMAISVSIIAVVGSLAIPSYSNLRHDSERTTAVNNFVHALYLARSESIKRGNIVSICKSPDGRTCNSRADWSKGWIVFANDDRDEPPQRDAGETLINVYPGWTGGTITSNRTAYSFRPNTQSVVNGTLVFCDGRGNEHARAIIISQTGRPRISPHDGSNQPLKCPHP